MERSGTHLQKQRYSGGRLPPAMPLYQQEEEPEMTQEQFNAMFEKAMRDYQTALTARPVDNWAEAAWAAAGKAGIFDGSAPQAPLTRAQAAAVFQRLKLLDK